MHEYLVGYFIFFMQPPFIERHGYFSSQINIFFLHLSQYSLRTNDCDELTWFLCMPAALARWEMSCAHLVLRESLAGEQKQAPGRMFIPI